MAAMVIRIAVGQNKADRIGTAFGHLYDLKDGNNQPRQATEAEIRGYVADYIRSLVKQSEEQKAREQVAPTDIDLSVDE